MLEFPTMILPAEYSSYSLVAVAFVQIICIGWFIRLELKARRMVRGKNAKDLESSILEMYKNAEENKKFRDDVEKHFLQVEKRLRRALQSAETVKFDAFKGTGSGGNQSFATACLNENGDGIIISSLSARERVSLFSKPIKDFKSGQELSPEEKEALKKAQTQLEL